MRGWVDQFGCYANQLCLVVAIAMSTCVAL
jgi:hypothetical protein